MSNLYPAFIHHFSNLGPSTRPSSSRLSALCPAFLQPLYLPFIHPVCTFFQPICYPHFIFLPTFRPPLAHLLSNLYPAESSPYPPFIQHLSNPSPSFFQLFSCPLSSFYPTSVQYPPFITLYPIFPSFIHPLSRPSPTVAFHSPVFPLLSNLYLFTHFHPASARPRSSPPCIRPLSNLYSPFIQPFSNLIHLLCNFFQPFPTFIHPLSTLYPFFIQPLSNLYPHLSSLYPTFEPLPTFHAACMYQPVIALYPTDIQPALYPSFIKPLFLSTFYPIFYPSFIQPLSTIFSNLYPSTRPSSSRLSPLYPADIQPLYLPFAHPFSTFFTRS